METAPIKKYKPKSEAYPPLTLNPNVETFTRHVTKDLRKLRHNKNKDANLTPKLRKALKNLQGNKNLVIKPADKGGNIVVQDTKQYKEICLKILRNTQWYGRSNLVAANKAHEALTKIIIEAFDDNIIDGDTKNFLINKYTKIPFFYALPKVHKGVLPPPGRPIVAGIDSSPEMAGRYVDDVLRPHVERMPSYVKDTLQLLQILDGLTIPVDSLLVTLDIEALYSSIPHEEGLKIIKFPHGTRPI